MIGFSSGSLHQLMHPDANHNDYLDFWRYFSYAVPFDAFEISMSPQHEKSFEISAENYNWLSQLRYLSYHLTLLTCTTNVLDQLPKNVAHYIAHQHTRYISDFSKIKSDSILIENLEADTRPFFLTDKICFDVNHASAVSDEYCYKFYQSNQHQIYEIHLSCYDPICKHVPFHNRQHAPIRLDLYSKHPIIIEENFDSIEEMEQEFAYIKNLMP